MSRRIRQREAYAVANAVRETLAATTSNTWCLIGSPMLLTAAMVDGLCYIESAEQGIRLCQLDVGFRRRILGRTDVSLTETLVVETHD
jgi:hypothetical protein